MEAGFRLRLDWFFPATRWGTVVAALAALVGNAQAQQVHRNGFESLKTSWVKGGFDAPYDLLAHASSDRGAHNGRRCEYLQVNVRPGNFLYWQYSTPQVAIGEETVAGLWVKANRPGIQVLARVVLPKERDPKNLDYRMATYIRGDTYRTTGRWQRLDLGRPVQLMNMQQQLLQAQLKRPVDFTDAYVDALVVNLYAGPGPTEVWIDDLEIGPVLPSNPFQPAARGAGDTPGKTTALPRRTADRSQIVEFQGNQLLVGGKRFFLRGIQHSDTPLRALRDAGFNAVILDHGAPESLVKDGVDLGFWIVPRLKAVGDDPRAGASPNLSQDIARFSRNDAVLFWHLGGTLAFEQAVPVSRAVQTIRQADPGRPLGADVWDGLLPMSRSLNMVGIHRWPLMTTLELPAYREWIDQRRRLANPGTFLWTWVQTHLPDWFSYVLYDRPGAGGFGEPVGPQPEHIRLLTYTALASGCKGLGFWSDRFLADSHQGRDRLLACALLNQELEMLEPFLTTADSSPQWIDTSVPQVKAAVLRTAKGILVLPIWQGAGSQFVPGQAAAAKLTMVVPQVPQSMQAWEISPGDVRGLRPKRVVGGMEITLPEFGLTGAVVFTADTNSIVRFQEQCRSRRQVASQWTYDMALYEMEKVLQVQGELEKMGRTVPDAPNLITDAQNRLRTARNLWESRLFSEAYREAERALRPLRILMRAQWEQAVKELDTPVASPYAVTFFTLPRHWRFMEEVRKNVPSPNLLPGGDFEIIPERVQETWRVEEPTIDPVEMEASRVGTAGGGKTLAKDDVPREGKQCLRLQIRPKGKGPVPQALERTLLALSSPSVRLRPGSLVQISAWVRIPAPITASADGALFYDNAGGEPLAIRLTQPTPWKKVTFYRRVPESGTIQVTLALTGLGTVYFDDVRVEPLQPGSGSTPGIVTTSGRR